MIISHEHKFIFLHCRKVAGSTITTLLNRYMGPEDLQTGAWPDTIEAGGRYNRKIIKIAFGDPLPLIKSSIWRSIKKGRPLLEPWTVNRIIQSHLHGVGLPGGAHPKASVVRDFDELAWQKYFKFCFVRNPWDHAVSDYYWRCRVRGCSHVTFKEFLKRMDDPERLDIERIVPPLRSNWEIYTIDDKVVVDSVGKFENLRADLREIGKSLGIELDLHSVPRSKGGIRKIQRSLCDLYDDEAVELVRRIYKKEIAEFGYQPNC